MRYLVKFTKQGRLKYISHLDLMRVFKRMFKRAGIALSYSQGFNPHPKMSLAHPLSLGYSSLGELLEFETREVYKAEELLGKMSLEAPEGLGLIELRELKEACKSPASTVYEASWMLYFPLEGRGCPDDDALKSFLALKTIEVEKYSRKTKKTKTVDLRPLIGELRAGGDESGRRLVFARLAAGSEKNLSPEQLLEALSKYAGLEIAREEIDVERLGIAYI